MLDLTQPTLLNQTSLPFNDARTCKDWLNSLPLTDVAQAHRLITDAVDSLNLTEMSGFERLKMMELMRDKVAFLQEKGRGSFAGKPVPLAPAAWEAWQRTADLWQGMEQGYRYALLAAANGDADTAKHAALIVQRCLRYSGLQIIYHGLACIDVPARLVTDLHQLFQYAEQRGVAHVAVKDSLDGHRGATTAAQSYVRALLVEAADIMHLSGRELLAVDALLKKWAAKVVISRIPPEGDPATLRCADLAGDKGLKAPVIKAVQRDTLMYLDLNALSDSLRRRLRRLAAGVAWHELSLPPAFASVQVATLLAHVQRCWCQAAAGDALTEPARDKCEVVGGLETLHHALTGKPFEAPRQSDDLGNLQAEQMAVFGKVIARSSSAGGKPASANAINPVETWKLEGASASRLRMRRPPSSHISLSQQQLIGYRGAAMAEYGLAIVRGLADKGSAGLLIDATPLPCRPEAIIFRAKESAFLPGLRLVEDADGPVTLIVPQGVFSAGKIVEVRTDAIQMYRLTGLTQRGANYEWVTCEAL